MVRVSTWGHFVLIRTYEEDTHAGKETLASLDFVTMKGLHHSGCYQLEDNKS